MYQQPLPQRCSVPSDGEGVTFVSGLTLTPSPSGRGADLHGSILKTLYLELRSSLRHSPSLQCPKVTRVTLNHVKELTDKEVKSYGNPVEGSVGSVKGVVELI